MKKVSIGSWAYAFAGNHIELPELCEKLHELKFDGISMGGFKPHANPEIYDTPEKRQGLKELLKKYDLGVADFACDLWSVSSLVQTEEWIGLFETNSQLAQDMGWDYIRVDSGAPPILPDGMDYEQAKAKVADNFKRIAKIAAQRGQQVVWEFEPGFVVNEPQNIVAMYDEVKADNFSILFDTCHGHMVSAKASRHIEPNRGAADIYEFIGMLKGKIGFVHLIDSDGTLNVEGTSTHAPFGLGELNFDKVIPALLDAGYTTDWWAIDLCEWPDAWQVTADCKAFVDKINEKFCK